MEIEVISLENTELSNTLKSVIFKEWFTNLEKTASFLVDFEQLISNVESDDVFKEHPEILMLKIRKLCQFPAIIPVVAAAPEVLDTIGKIEAKYGGTAAVPIMFPERQPYIFNGKYMIAFGETLHVIGFMINRRAPVMKYYEPLDYNNTFMLQNYINIPNENDNIPWAGSGKFKEHIDVAETDELLNTMYSRYNRLWSNMPYLIPVREEIVEIVKPVVKPRKSIYQNWIKVLEPIVRTDNTFDTNIWFDMAKYPWIMSRIYLDAIGRDTDENLAKRLKIVMEENKNYKELLAKATAYEDSQVKARYEESRLLYYYGKKFGEQKLKKLVASGGKMKLSELQIVKSMAVDIPVDNSPESEIARKMRYETSQIERMHLYKKLRHYVTLVGPKSTNNNSGSKEFDWIRTKDGAPLICPHVRDVMELMLGSSKLDDIREYIIQNYGSETSLDDAYYCRICGETIAQNKIVATQELSIEGYGHTVDELYQTVRRNVSWIVGSKVEFLGEYSMNEKREFVESISGKLSPWVDAVEKKLSRTRSLTQDDRDMYQRLLLIIYIFAVLMKIVLDNVKKVGFIGVKSNANAIIKYIVDKTQEINEDAMIKLNLTSDYVNSMLLKAYDSMTEKITLSEHTEYGFVEFLVSTQIYRLLQQRNVVKALHGIKRESEIVATIARSSMFNAVMGDDPKNVGARKNYWDGIETSKDELGWLLDYYSGRKTSVNFPTYIRHFTTMGAIAGGSRQITIGDVDIYINIIYGSSVSKETAKLVGESVPDSKLHKHKWNITLFKHPGGREILVHKPGTKFEFTNAIYVDTVCSICFHKYSSITSLRGVMEEIIENEDKTAFYIYYTSQCPLGILHNFEDAACKNCGITRDDIANLGDEYYKKYLPMFKKREMRIHGKRLDIVFTPETVPKVKIDNSVLIKFVDTTWDIVYQGSDIPDSHYRAWHDTKAEYQNIVNWIGAENFDIDMIKTGKTEPPINAARRDCINKIIVSTFNDIDTIVWMDPNVTVRDHSTRLIIESFEGVRIKELSVLSLMKKLGDYYDIYSKLDDVDTQVNYSFQYLLNLIMAVASIEKIKGIKPVGAKEFMLHLIHIFLKTGEVNSKLKAQKRVAVEASQGSGVADPNIVDNSTSKMYDDLVDPDYVDRYGYQEMDYDGSNEDINT